MKDDSIDFGKGAIESPYDIRDYWYTPADRGAFDWKQGFDIEHSIGVNLQVKDQNGSGSCGGQAWSYYGEVLEKIVTGTYEPRSARWIYSHTRVPTGGSRGKDNCAFVCKKGFALELYAPSYENGKPPKESFMIQIPSLSKQALEDLEVSKAISYLQVPTNMEVMAQAMQENNGIVLVVNGSDNGTWRSQFPKPPKVKEWGHFLYAGKARMIKGKKYIGVINSWGTKTGDSGWQWLGEEWFTNPKLGVREGWTLAWDYRPATHKKILIETVRLLNKVIDLMKVQRSLK